MRDIIVLISESVKNSLEATFGTEDNYNVQDSDDGPALFPDGGQWFICDDWACYVKRVLGNRAKIFGFWVEDNPEARALADLVDGHTFAVVDDRFIVDGWVKNVEAITNRAVFDLHDSNDAELIRSLYGDPKKWRRMIDAENAVTREPEAFRHKALVGTKFHS